MRRIPIPSQTISVPKDDASKLKSAVARAIETNVTDDVIEAYKTFLDVFPETRRIKVRPLGSISLGTLGAVDIQMWFRKGYSYYKEIRKNKRLASKASLALACLAVIMIKLGIFK